MELKEDIEKVKTGKRQLRLEKHSDQKQKKERKMEEEQKESERKQRENKRERYKA